MAEQKRAAAYVPWGTFRNQIAKLCKHGLPNQIDTTVFIGLAGGTQYQLIAALKFLGLIDAETSAPSEDLKQMEKQDDEARKKTLRKVFEASYSKLFDLDLTSATPQQLNEALEKHYAVSGSTLRKAVRFFLSGAKELGIKVSPFLEKAAATKPKGGGNGKRRRVSKKKKKAVQKVDPAEAGTTGTSRTVSLESGGTLTLSATLDLFKLNPADRNFVFELIDKLEKYESSRDEQDDNDELAEPDEGDGE